MPLLTAQLGADGSVVFQNHSQPGDTEVLASPERVAQIQASAPIDYPGDDGPGTVILDLDAYTTVYMNRDDYELVKARP